MTVQPRQDSSASTRSAAGPILKWAGGKRQLLPELRRFYPSNFGAYVEPFVGSGAVFFDLYNKQFLTKRQVTLVDSNADLIGCYLALRDRTDAVIRALKRLARERERAPASYYYSVRDTQFNPARRRLLNGNVLQPANYTPALAAMLIYLNRTGFNGLFRLNADGLFNVPVGSYVNPTICDEDKLRLAAAAFRQRGTRILRGDFEVALAHAQRGDFVYFDPPYAPVSKTSQFTAYTADRFLVRDQMRLQRVVIELAFRGCFVLLSNSVAPEIRDLYDENDEARSAGLRAYKVLARRAINSRPNGRGAIHEYLVTNVTPNVSGDTHAR